MSPIATPLARRAADASLAVFVVLVVGMMIVPLPTPLLDVLIASNIAIAVLLLLVATFSQGGLALTSFPTILLVTTLFRLALNVSSTRLILLQADAGTVIRSFGEFVVQGDYVVGAVVFLILTLIQYLVIAKGSERVAEVGARFTLDAMPGKQMAIDAEVRSGALGHDEARRRRAMLSRESQFYGAMDGAMKFVKGDAIAGIVITAINIVGGLAIGMGSRDLGAVESLRIYGLLTIGDGLVSQIPSLLLSVAAGLVVTRVASEDEHGSLGGDVARQIFGDPRALAIAAGLLAVLAVIPGLPTAPFLVLAAALGGLAWRLARARPAARTALTDDAPADAIAIDVDPALADALRDVDLPAASRRIAGELGLVLPEPRVRPDPALARGGYAIRIHDLPAARGEAKDPAAIARELELAVRRRAHELLGLQETQTLLDRLERTHPALVRHVVPKPIAPPLLADVLRRLLEEGISIRPLREILDALATHGATEKDPAILTEAVRAALRRHLTHVHAPEGALALHLVDPEIEETIRDAIRRTPAGPSLALAPQASRDVLGAVRRAIDGTPGPAILLTQPDVRPFLRKLLRAELPDVVVLAHPELDPGVTVRPLGRVSLS